MEFDFPIPLLERLFWQYSLLERVGSSDWDVDLDKGVLSFSNGDFFRISICGSWQSQDHVWQWGWANMGLADSGLPSENIQRYGEVHAIDYLVDPFVPCSEGGSQELAMISCHLLHAGPYYRCQHGEISVYAVLPRWNLKKDVHRLGSAMMRAVEDYCIRSVDRNHLFDLKGLCEMTASKMEVKSKSDDDAVILISNVAINIHLKVDHGRLAIVSN